MQVPPTGKMARTYRYTFAICAALLLWGRTGHALAAEPPRAATTRFDIAQGSLDDGLKALATQGRVQILYPPRLVAHRRSAGLRAELSPIQALASLLKDSGLQAVAVNANTFLLQRVPVVVVRPAPQPVRARARPQGPVDLGSVQVTGSHIPRSSLEHVTAAPLTLISRAEIEASGHQTLFELLRFQPGMHGHHPVAVAADGDSTSQQPFASAGTTSLNSLGPRATLFLVDGHRIASYGLISADLGGLTDLDAIPLSIVDRIEIIRGGASAIYGADAMAGVVNIILRKERDGGEVVARRGVSSRSDAKQESLAFGFGVSTPGGGSVFIGGDYSNREALYGDQRGWRGFDRRIDGLGDWRFQLGYLNKNREMIQPHCPGSARAQSRRCLFDPAREGTLQPASERASLYVHGHQPIGDATQWHADVRVSDSNQMLRGAPFYGLVELTERHPDVIPGSTYLVHAFYDVGPVRNRNQARSLDVSTGFKGWRGDWQWDLTLAHHTNTVDNRIDGLVRDTAFTAAMIAGTYRFDGTPNDPKLLAALSPPVESHGKASLDQVSFDMHGPWFHLPAGDAIVAAGMELSRDALLHRPDALMQEHDLALSPQKIHIDEHRYGAALYTELSLPLLSSLQADLALRLDRRQGYGSKTSPKLGIKWRATDTLTARGTVATGYRAPSLYEQRRPSLYEGVEFVRQTPQMGECLYRLEIDRDTAYCLVSRSAIENPDLRPETSRSHTIGLVWAPTRNFSLSVDHFRIQRRNEILPGSLLDDAEAFPLSGERDEYGQLFGIRDYFANVGRSDVRGWDIEAQYQFATQRLGDFTLRFNGHHLDRLSRRAYDGAPTRNHAGHGAPDRTVLVGVRWNVNDWTTTLNLRNLGASSVSEPGEDCPERHFAVRHCSSPGSTTFDLDLAYTGLRNWRLGLNVRDLTDRRPVNYVIANGGYDIANDDPRGRYFQFSAAYRY